MNDEDYDGKPVGGRRPKKPRKFGLRITMHTKFSDRKPFTFTQWYASERSRTEARELFNRRQPVGGLFSYSAEDVE